MIMMTDIIFDEVKALFLHFITRRTSEMSKNALLMIDI